MAEPKEPQSYGSGKDWQTGDTGQEVNRQKGKPNSQHAEFYESHREARVGPEGGGFVSPEQLAENVEPAGRSSDPETPVKKVTARNSGFFKNRDYK